MRTSAHAQTRARTHKSHAASTPHAAQGSSRRRCRLYPSFLYVSLLSYMSPFSLICLPSLLHVSLLSYMSPFSLTCLSSFLYVSLLSSVSPLSVLCEYATLTDTCGSLFAVVEPALSRSSTLAAPKISCIALTCTYIYTCKMDIHEVWIIGVREK